MERTGVTPRLAGTANSLLIAWDGARRVLHRARAADGWRDWLACAGQATSTLLRIAIVVAPFLLLQASPRAPPRGRPLTPRLQLWAWLRFCVEGLGGASRPWCSDTLPFVYGFVQREYWGLGPLAFWRPEQAPNFALAAPVLLLTACGVACSVRGAARRRLDVAAAFSQAKPRELVMEEQQASACRALPAAAHAPPAQAAERSELQRQRCAGLRPRAPRQLTPGAAWLPGSWSLLDF